MYYVFVNPMIFNMNYISRYTLDVLVCKYQGPRSDVNTQETFFCDIVTECESEMAVV